jgi:uncharacterized protein YceH (UPF0502 family)
MELAPEEQRVLGCLLEKAATTPEQYPLTMNALIAACNQASNRGPIVNYKEADVATALAGLRERQLIRIVYPAHARVTKYRHVLDEVWALSPPELAVVAVLLLRGPQTLNELAVRTERYDAEFEDLGGVPGVLRRLAGRPEPLARQLERHPGQREDRFAHLLGTPPLDSPISRSQNVGESELPPLLRQPSRSDRITALEVETANLRRDLETLRDRISDLLD